MSNEGQFGSMVIGQASAGNTIRGQDALQLTLPQAASAMTDMNDALESLINRLRNLTSELGIHVPESPVPSNTKTETVETVMLQLRHTLGVRATMQHELAELVQDLEKLV